MRLGEDWALPLVAGLVGPARNWTLVLDRTNWSIGSREVNYLVLAVVTRRFRVPLLWTVLPGKGNSSMEARIALVRRTLAHFPSSTIGILLADREFVGAKWLEFLNDNNIPFSIRLRENLRVVWLTVVSNLPPRRALQAYRRRWAIECMFGDGKTRGLNIEDTRLTCSRKLALLMAIVAIALAWAGRAAADLLGNREPERKSHGYLARSYFRIGLDHIRSLLRSDPVKATHPWSNLPLKPQESPRVV